ncbi:MAG: hypothetical protein FJ161_04010, partial [Gammaproteobacteria bacterium]|nr:hypothetical protein [Gammaproteobacteria bacterium]
MLKKEIIASEIADPALVPFDENYQARAMIENLNTEKNLGVLKEAAEVFPKCEDVVEELLKSLPLVREIFPDKQRLTTLDLVCRTANLVINVEIQCISQPYWDLRMLVHGSGLVYKQIRKGFDWN